MTPVFELNDLHVSLQSRHKEIKLPPLRVLLRRRF